MARKVQFIIIGRHKSKNDQDLVRVIRARGHSVRVVELKDVLVSYKNGKIVPTYKGRRIDTGAVYLFRAYNRNYVIAQILAGLFVRQGKIVIDSALARRTVPSKVYEASIYVQNGIPHPATFQAADGGSYEELLRQVPFPIVVKPVYGQMGRGIEKFDSKKKALAFLNKNRSGYFIQEYIPAESDYRVLVIGNKVIGMLERFAAKGEFRTNALGAHSDKAPLTREVRILALKATRSLGYDIAGVDLIKHHGKWLVLETNANPQWQNLKGTLGVDVAEYVVDYALQQYRKK
ncbi:MAG: RimK family alpha-L-glutamate ligase [Candidatus Kerfeldbacteria bacterium]